MMSETIEAVSSVVSDIPDGYTVSSVNTETGEPVFEPIPKTDEQKEIDSLKTAAYALASVSTTLTDEQALSMPEFFTEGSPILNMYTVRLSADWVSCTASSRPSLFLLNHSRPKLRVCWRYIARSTCHTLARLTILSRGCTVWTVTTASITAITARFTNAPGTWSLAFGNPVRQVFTSGRKSLDRLSVHHYLLPVFCPCPA